MTTTPPATDPRLMSEADLATIADYFETHETTTGREMLAELSDQIKALTAELDRMRQERTDAERVVALIEDMRGRYLKVILWTARNWTVEFDDKTPPCTIELDSGHPGEEFWTKSESTLLAALEAAAAAKGESP